MAGLVATRQSGLAAVAEKALGDEGVILGDEGAADVLGDETSAAAILRARGEQAAGAADGGAMGA